jgi:hypothetical protein
MEFCKRAAINGLACMGKYAGAPDAVGASNASLFEAGYKY